MAAPLPDFLQQAEKALHDGNVQQARALLVEFIKTNPRSDRAWWLLSFAVAETGQQIDCLKRALQLNPAHAEARERLAKLSGPSSLPPLPVQPLPPAVSPFITGPDSEEPWENDADWTSSSPPALTPTWPAGGETPAPASPDLPRAPAFGSPPAPALQPLPSAAGQTASSDERAAPKGAPPAPRKAGRKWFVADLVMVLLVLSVAGFTAYYFFGRPSAASTELSAQQTQAMAQALTGMPVATLPPTWTWTPTLLPSATDTPTETPVITATPETTLTETGIPTSQIGPGIRMFAPDFTLTDSVTGEQVSLSQFKGQAVLLFFWNVNCPYCLAEVYDLESAYDEYSVEGFVLLAIDAGDSQAEVNRFRSTWGVKFPTLLDPGRVVTTTYEVYMMPIHFFINASGRISNITQGQLSLNNLKRQIGLIMATAPTATPSP
jgi:peroxiredoxin